MTLNPSLYTGLLASYYNEQIKQGHISEDQRQLAAVTILDEISRQLIMQHTSDSHEAPYEDSDHTVRSPGLYLWGKVGRGKTWLMDIFYQHLPLENKTRTHYYRFMRDIHQRMKQLQGTANPLQHIADDISQSVKVLCLDEFFVSDIGDAMILSRLLQALFEAGVCVITTSNVEPSLLYQDGLQRDRFLPAIELIYQRMQVHQLDGQEDHRLKKTSSLERYYTPCDIENQKRMWQSFQKHSQGSIQQDPALAICDRTINARHADDHQAWFDFNELCMGARSQLDYIELASRYDHVYVDGVPQMGGQVIVKEVARGTEDTVNINQVVADRPFEAAKSDDEARRFISLVDELYDRRVGISLCADVAITDLYTGGRVEAEFERTISRLIEMQSEGYAQQRHLEDHHL